MFDTISPGPTVKLTWGPGLDLPALMPTPDCPRCTHHSSPIRHPGYDTPAVPVIFPVTSWDASPEPVSPSPPCRLPHLLRIVVVRPCLSSAASAPPCTRCRYPLISGWRCVNRTKAGIDWECLEECYLVQPMVVSRAQLAVTKLDIDLNIPLHLPARRRFITFAFPRGRVQS